MLVRDVMVAPVITVGPSATVQEVAKLFLEKQISAVPVLDNNGKLVGIVSEGDLLHRVEAGTERHRSWWLRVLVESDTLAAEYVKSHSRKVSDVMTRDVITTSPQAPLHEVAAVMENNAVKRLPVLENGQLVGVVSRANLLQAVASARQLLDVAPTDKAIRDRILSSLKKQAWSSHRTAERHRRQRHRRSLGHGGFGCRAKGDQGGSRIRRRCRRRARPSGHVPGWRLAMRDFPSSPAPEENWKSAHPRRFSPTASSRRSCPWASGSARRS